MDRPTTLTLAALGGQGGGVVTSWLVDVAERENHQVQATSVPGVAQRTGATIYYLEFHHRRPQQPAAVMALMPTPGISDIVVASELLEAARMIERGIVNRRQTTLISSTHREYAISEKSVAGDGRADSKALMQLTQASAKRLVTLDMAAIAQAQGAVVSAAMLGAIAGAGVLPFAPDAYRAAVCASGIAVSANLACFEAAFAAAAGQAPEPRRPSAAKADQSTAADVVRPTPLGFQSPPPQRPKAPGTGDVGMSGLAEAEAIAEDKLSAATEQGALPAEATEALNGYPAALRPILAHCIERLADYQDARYSGDFLRRMNEILDLDLECNGYRLFTATARGLALWMSFEDVIRVADLKIRRSRRRRLLAGANLQPGQLMRVTEFLAPRPEEICGTLPRRLGGALMRRPWARRFLAKVAGPRTVVTTNLSGYLLLRCIAGMKRLRRRSLRYFEEHEAIDAWFTLVKDCARLNYELACEVAESQQLASGYGDTLTRGKRQLERVVACARSVTALPQPSESAAAALAAAARVRAIRDEVLNGPAEEWVSPSPRSPASVSG